MGERQQDRWREVHESSRRPPLVLEDVTKTSGKETFELTLDKNEKTYDANKTTDDFNKALFNFTDVKKDYSNLKYQMVTVLYKNNDKSKGLRRFTLPRTTPSRPAS